MSRSDLFPFYQCKTRCDYRCTHHYFAMHMNMKYDGAAAAFALLLELKRLQPNPPIYGFAI